MPTEVGSTLAAKTMGRDSCDVWKYPDGRFVAVQPGRVVEGAVLYNGYDYKNQFWVRNGELVHHGLCGKTHDAFGKPWSGGCNACEFIKKAVKPLPSGMG